jgi:hypothetical protein
MKLRLYNHSLKPIGNKEALPLAQLFVRRGQKRNAVLAECGAVLAPTAPCIGAVRMI